MKTYDYTCRDAKGGIRRGRLEAQDRAGAVRALKARGLAAVSLSEGGAASRADAPPTGGGMRRALLWAAPCAAALALGALWLGARGGVRGEARGAGAPPSEAGAAPRVDTRPPGGGTDRKEGRPPEDTAGRGGGPGAGVLEGATPGGGAAVPPAPRRPGIRRLDRDGNVIEPEGGGDEPPPPDTTFRTQTEHLLSVMLSAPPGIPMPPMPAPPGMEGDFAASLANVITIHGDDTEEMAGRKERVAWAKLDMAEMVKGGASPGDALRAVEQGHNALAEYRQALLRQYVELRREGGEGEADAFLGEANENLRQYGLPPLALPPVLTGKEE